MLVDIYARSMLHATRQDSVGLRPLPQASKPAIEAPALPRDMGGNLRASLSRIASHLALRLSPETARGVISAAPQAALNALHNSTQSPTLCK